LPKSYCKRVLFTADEIGRRVTELGHEISREYRGRDVILVGILKGSLIFLADLVRNIDIPVSIDFMCVETYTSGTVPDDFSNILYKGGGGYTGKDIIIVEDIIDTGLTLRYIIQTLEVESPKTLEICTLLEKESSMTQRITAKYVGFAIPSEFVIGYGMDYRGRYRGLPYIGVYNEEGNR